MKLAEVMAVSRLAEAVYQDGTIRIERASEERPDVEQSYWWDVRCSQMRRHGGAMGDFGLLADLEETLREWDIEPDSLDWSASQTPVDFGQCACKDCTSFSLAYRLMPYGLPVYMRVGYWLLWRVQDVQWWCWWTWYRLWWKLFGRRKLEAAYNAVCWDGDEDD